MSITGQSRLLQNLRQDSILRFQQNQDQGQVSFLTFIENVCRQRIVPGEKESIRREVTDKPHKRCWSEYLKFESFFFNFLPLFMKACTQQIYCGVILGNSHSKANFA